MFLHVFEHRKSQPLLHNVEQKEYFNAFITSSSDEATLTMQTHLKSASDAATMKTPYKISLYSIERTRNDYIKFSFSSFVSEWRWKIKTFSDNNYRGLSDLKKMI